MEKEKNAVMEKKILELKERIIDLVGVLVWYLTSSLQSLKQKKKLLQ